MCCFVFLVIEKEREKKKQTRYHKRHKRREKYRLNDMTEQDYRVESLALAHVREKIAGHRGSADLVLRELDVFAWNKQWMMFVGDGRKGKLVRCLCSSDFFFLIHTHAQRHKRQLDEGVRRVVEKKTKGENVRVLELGTFCGYGGMFQRLCRKNRFTHLYLHKQRFALRDG